MTKSTWHQRFMGQIREEPAPAHLAHLGPCWTSTKWKMPNGYAMFWLDGKKRYVHRVAYKKFVGPIPDGLHIDHLCRNRLCCNPSHLEAVTQRENTLRGDTFAARKSRQTECINGHPFDEVNTYHAPNGTRKCRECRRVARDKSRIAVSLRKAKLNAT